MHREDPQSPLSILVTELYNRHHKELVNYANYFVEDKEVAEDIVHDCYAKILTHEDKDKFVKMEPYELKAYVYRMVRNSCLNYLRKKKKGLDPELVKIRLFNELTPEEKDILTIRQKLLEELYRVWQGLTDQDKKILYLKYFKKLKAKNIAEILEIPPHTVENRLRAIRDLFRRNL